MLIELSTKDILNTAVHPLDGRLVCIFQVDENGGVNSVILALEQLQQLVTLLED